MELMELIERSGDLPNTKLEENYIRDGYRGTDGFET
jgi:hypothetical protein